jgi:hypothetical protein
MIETPDIYVVVNYGEGRESAYALDESGEMIETVDRLEPDPGDPGLADAVAVWDWEAACICEEPRAESPSLVSALRGTLTMVTYVRALDRGVEARERFDEAERRGM